MATLAALALYANRPVALLVGGHDRGLPWDEFAVAMRSQAPRTTSNRVAAPACHAECKKGLVPTFVETSPLH